MRDLTRRDLLADVGRGMLVGTVGAAIAADMELIPRGFAEESGSNLTFGDLEPLVDLMQNTRPEKLLPAVVGRINKGTSLKTLVAAGGLANARRFGGQDYTGYHTFMALAPAYAMAQQLPSDQAPLPVLKVLYRNANRIQETGGPSKEVLRRVAPAKLPKDVKEDILQQATRSADYDKAEATFAALAQGPIGEAYNHLQFAIQDEMNVHRVVLSWRAWAMLDIVGRDHAHTLLRQSVRFCVDSERRDKGRGRSQEIRKLLPKLIDQYRLLSRATGGRKVDDGWIEKMAQTVYSAPRARAADAVAAALAEGIDPEAIGEAISLAACWLVLHDRGRTKARPGKGIGSVHGDSVGVHASDSANAWRNIARASNARNRVASLIAAAYHTAGQSRGQHKQPYPFAGHLKEVKARDDKGLLRELDAAVRDGNQSLASALVAIAGKQSHSAKPILSLLLRYATSEDGALHAEKYFQTVTEEFRIMRPRFRWSQLVALARVTASEHGTTAPGYQQARELLKLG